MSAVDFSIDAGQRLGFSEASLTADTIAQIAEVLRVIADGVEELVFTSWPVDTGRSLRAWRIFVDGSRLVVQNPVEYVSFINKGTSAERVQVETERGWQQRQGLIQEILDRATQQQELFRAPAGSFLGDAARAAVARQLLQASGISALPGGSLFTSLRGAFSIQRIAQRERGRQRSRARTR